MSSDASAAEVETKSDIGPRQSSFSGWRIVVLLVVAVVLATRRLTLLLSPAAWAEDLSVIFPAAMRLGPASLIEPFNAYHITLLRMIGYAASWLPVDWTQEVYVYMSLAVTMAVAAAVLSLRLGLPWWANAGFALAIVLVPHGGEIWLNLKNTQWFTALLLVAIPLARPPRTAAARVGWGGVFALAALTGPFVVFFLPVVLIGIWRADDRPWRWTLVVISLASAALHVSAALGGDRMSEISKPGSLDNEALYALVKTVYAYLGGFFHAPPDVAWMMPLALAGWLVLAWLTLRGVPAVWRGETVDRDPSHARHQWVCLLVAAACAWAMGAYAGIWTLRYSFFFRPLGVADANGGPRYAYLPYVITLWLLIWASARVASPRIRRVAALIAVFVMAGVFCFGRYAAVTPHHDSELPTITKRLERDATPLAAEK